MGVVLEPVYHHLPGQLYVAQNEALKVLSTQGGVITDASFGLPFEKRADARDSRPLQYPGRLVFPRGMNEQGYRFWNCPLNQKRRTPEVRMILGREMLVMEDGDVEVPVPSYGGTSVTAMQVFVGRSDMSRLALTRARRPVCCIHSL